MHDISGTLCQTFVQIGPHSSEISLLIWESFCYFSIIVTLKLYNFYTVLEPYRSYKAFSLLFDLFPSLLPFFRSPSLRFAFLPSYRFHPFVAPLKSVKESRKLPWSSLGWSPSRYWICHRKYLNVLCLWPCHWRTYVSGLSPAVRGTTPAPPASPSSSWTRALHPVLQSLHTQSHPRLKYVAQFCSRI